MRKLLQTAKQLGFTEAHSELVDLAQFIAEFQKAVPSHEAFAGRINILASQLEAIAKEWDAERRKALSTVKTDGEN